MDKRYICPCGLICSDCLFYKPEIYETAKKLKDEIKSSKLDVFLELAARNESWETIAKHLGKEEKEVKKCFTSLKKLPDFMEVLEALIKLQCGATCRETGGCCISGTFHKCETVKCVQEKGYEGCWDCPEAPKCKKLDFVRSAYGETIVKIFGSIKEKES